MAYGFGRGVGPSDPAFIDLEHRHPSSEEQAHLAEGFKRRDDEVAAMTPAEYKKFVHPNLWRRFKQFWGVG
jgi:hypothetical protein